MINHYATAAKARAGVRVYNLAIIALNERTPDDAKAWLLRDANRADAESAEAERVGEVAASQLDYNRRPIGRKSKEAAPWFTKANALHRAARECREAGVVVHASPAFLASCLQDAVAQYAKFCDDASKEKGQETIKGASMKEVVSVA